MTDAVRRASADSQLADGYGRHCRGTMKRAFRSLPVAALAIAVVSCGSSATKTTSATTTGSATTTASAATSSAGAAGTSAAAATTTKATAAATTAVSATSSATTASAATGGAAATTLAAVQTFLATLDATQKTTVLAERTQANLSLWSNLPDQLFKRAGLRMDKLSADQQKAVLAILAAALSPEGYTQVTQISTADGVLAASGGANLDFGADHYWIRFVGTPSATTAWTIQYGGHHLAVNVTIVGSKMTLAPTLWGAQPASYTDAGSTFEPLSGETTKAFALMDALDATQQTAAILTTATKEIVLGAGQDGKTLAAEGVKASTFTPAQKQLLLALVQEWLRPLDAENSGRGAARRRWWHDHDRASGRRATGGLR